MPSHRQEAYYRDPTHLVDLANFLFGKEHSFRDFTFIINGDRVKVHKLIIRSVGSEQFRRKFDEWDAAGENKAEIEIKSILDQPVETKMFRLFIQYCYTGSLNWREIDDQGLLDLFAICSDYGFHHLADVLSEGAANRAYITIWNVWNFFEASTKYGFQPLHDHCIRFIDRHALAVLNEDDLFYLNPKLFKTLIGRDTLWAKEVDILKALISYLKNYPKENEGKTIEQELITQLLHAIRWTLITKREFEDIVLPSGLMTLDQYNGWKEDKKERARYDPDHPPRDLYEHYCRDNDWEAASCDSE